MHTPPSRRSTPASPAPARSTPPPAQARSTSGIRPSAATTATTTSSTTTSATSARAAAQSPSSTSTARTNFPSSRTASNASMKSNTSVGSASPSPRAGPASRSPPSVARSASGTTAISPTSARRNTTAISSSRSSVPSKPVSAASTPQPRVSSVPPPRVGTARGTGSGTARSQQPTTPPAQQQPQSPPAAPLDPIAEPAPTPVVEELKPAPTVEETPMQPTSTPPTPTTRTTTANDEAPSLQIDPTQDCGVDMVPPKLTVKSPSTASEFDAAITAPPQVKEDVVQVQLEQRHAMPEPVPQPIRPPSPQTFDNTPSSPQPKKSPSSPQTSPKEPSLQRPSSPQQHHQQQQQHERPPSPNEPERPASPQPRAVSPTPPPSAKQPSTPPASPPPPKHEERKAQDNHNQQQQHQPQHQDVVVDAPEPIPEAQVTTTTTAATTATATTEPIHNNTPEPEPTIPEINNDHTTQQQEPRQDQHDDNQAATTDDTADTTTTTSKTTTKSHEPPQQQPPSGDKMADPKWLVELVQQDTGQWRQYACGAIQNMAVADENRIDLVHKYGAVPPLLAVIADLEADDKSREFACGAIWALATAPENRNTIKEAGAIPILWKIVEDSGERTAESACGALQNLAIDESINVSMATEFEFVPKIVVILNSKASSKKQEVKRSNALSILWSLSVSPANKMSLIGVSGLVDGLVAVMRETTEERHRELACGTIQNLAIYDENKISLVKAPWLVDTLINLIKLDIMNGSGTQEGPKTAQFACGALHQLAKAISVISFDILGVCETVLTSPIPTVKSKEYAIGILFGIAFVEENKKPMLKATALMNLICKMMAGQDQPPESVEKFREYACGALWGLAISDELRLPLVEKFHVLNAATIALECSNPKAVEHTCCLVQNLLISEGVKPILKGNTAIISAFAKALSQPWNIERIRELGCGALQTLLTITEPNKELALVIAPAVLESARNQNTKAQTRACGVLWTLCQVKDAKHDLVADHNVLSIFAESLLSDDSKTRKFSSASLLHLSDDKDNRIAMASDVKLLKAMFKVIKLDNSKLREHCCGALCGLCFEESVRPTIALNHREFIPSIVHVANASTGQTQMYSSGAIWGLSFAKENVEPLMKCDVAQVLEKGAKTEITGKLCEYSCATLQNISVIENLRQELTFVVPTLLEIIVKILPTYDPAAKSSKSARILESCCAVVHNVSLVEGSRVAMVREHGSLKPMVTILTTCEGKLRDLACSTLRNLSQEASVRRAFTDDSLGLVKALMKFVESEDPNLKRCRKLAFGTLKNLPLDDTSLNLLALHSSSLASSGSDKRNSNASLMDVTPRTVNALIGRGSEFNIDSDMEDTRSVISNTPRTVRGGPDLEGPVEENVPKEKKSRRLSLFPWRKHKEEETIPEETGDTLAVPNRSSRRFSSKK